MKRLPLHSIDAAGADATNNTLVFNPDTGQLEYGPGGVASTNLVPLTTTVAGEPQLVWDENDNLVMTEVPL